MKIRDAVRKRSFSLYLTVVEVGLIPLNFSVTENETFPVCAMVTNGILGCNLTIYLGANSSSAVGESDLAEDHIKP